MNPVLVLAEESSGAGGCGGGGIQPILFMLMMFAVFWFILIRPQQKRAKEHAAMLNNLKKGDEVVTRGGIVGTISGVKDNLITIEVQEKVRVRVLKTYIESKLSANAVATSTGKGDNAAPAATE